MKFIFFELKRWNHINIIEYLLENIKFSKYDLLKCKKNAKNKKVKFLLKQNIEKNYKFSIFDYCFAFFR